MLDNLRKKKFLESMMDQGQESKKEYIQEMKKQGAENDDLRILMNGGNKKNNLADKPVYDTMKKVPYIDQLEKTKSHMEQLQERDEKDPRWSQDETEEERKRRMLEGLFPLSKNQGLS